MARGNPKTPAIVLPWTFFVPGITAILEDLDCEDPLR